MTRPTRILLRPKSAFLARMSYYHPRRRPAFALMTTRRILQTTRHLPIYSQFARPSVTCPTFFRFPFEPPSRLAKSLSTSHFNTIRSLSTSTTMASGSKRDPTMYSFMNGADLVEGLLKEDGFTTWGFVIFRCTYHNNSDWENFMARMVGAVSEDLKEYSGLDLLDTFAPTVLEDPSFEGATVATLREHFHQWKKTALKEEQGVSEDYTPTSGRYRFFITVDQEAMESVLNTPLGGFEEYELGHVRMVNAEWKWTDVPEEDSEDEDISEPEVFEPLEGCTEDDVGWMNIRWRIVQLPGFHKMTEIDDWQAYYVRYPGIADIN